MIAQTHAPLIMPKEEKTHDVFNLKETPKEDLETKDAKVLVGEHSQDISVNFETERIEWRDKVGSMSRMLLDISKIAELQVALYSNRQIALEKMHYYLSLWAKVNAIYKKKAGKKWDAVMTGDRKLKQGEAGIQVEGELSMDKEKIEMLEFQADYFKETIKGIDNIVFGLSHMIKAEEYKRA